MRLKRAGPKRLISTEPLLLPAPPLADALSGRLPRKCLPSLPAIPRVPMPQLPHIPRVSLPRVSLPSLSWWRGSEKVGEDAGAPTLSGAAFC